MAETLLAQGRMFETTSSLGANSGYAAEKRCSSTGFGLRRCLHNKFVTVPVYRHTSFVVLAVGAEGFHGYMTAGSSPAWLANAVPSTGFQGAPSVVVAETWTTLWE